MKTVVIAMLLLTAGFVVVAAAPTASACYVGTETPVQDAIACTNPPIDYVQCQLTGHCG